MLNLGGYRKFPTAGALSKFSKIGVLGHIRDLLNIRKHPVAIAVLEKW